MVNKQEVKDIMKNGKLVKHGKKFLVKYKNKSVVLKIESKKKKNL